MRIICNQECEVPSNDHHELGYEYGFGYLNGNRICNDPGEISHWSGPNVYLNCNISLVVLHMTKLGLYECSTSKEVKSLNNVYTRNTTWLPLVSYRWIQQQVVVEINWLRQAVSLGLCQHILVQTLVDLYIHHKVFLDLRCQFRSQVSVICGRF